MFALEIGSEGDPTLRHRLRHLVEMLLRIDPRSDYVLCRRGWHGRGDGLGLEGRPNVRSCVLADPWNGWRLRDVRLFHGLGGFVPWTPRRLPKLVSIHDVTALGEAGAKRRRAVSRADHVVTPSAFAAEAVRELCGVDAERIHCVPLGVDGRRFYPLPTDEVVEIHERYGDYALAASRAGRDDNLETLVQAVRSIETLRLVVLGPGDATLGAALGDRLIRLDSVSDDERLRLLNGASVFVEPGLGESFAGPVLEAMACGVPVVCANSGALPEAAEGAALLTDASDVDALATALTRVVNDRELAVSLRRQGLARAHEWTWGRAAERLRSLYDEILAGEG